MMLSRLFANLIKILLSHASLGDDARKALHKLVKIILVR